MDARTKTYVDNLHKIAECLHDLDGVLEASVLDTSTEDEEALYELCINIPDTDYHMRWGCDQDRGDTAVWEGDLYADWEIGYQETVTSCETYGAACCDIARTIAAALQGYRLFISNGIFRQNYTVQAAGTAGN
jgi:hypothetical protein